ncbi:hypothetical protein Sjap_000515 [Stephania japonica]|uniref:Uncharacterized protein n=1 Tax=Stephania japonica TaxID=461633 RepID=A0AAP0KJ63_9MAGN
MIIGIFRVIIGARRGLIFETRSAIEVCSIPIELHFKYLQFNLFDFSSDYSLSHSITALRWLSSRNWCFYGSGVYSYLEPLRDYSPPGIYSLRP